MSDAQMRGPKGCAKTLSFGGQTYTAQKGIFTVPVEAVAHLKYQGFTVDGTEDAVPAGGSTAADQVAAEVTAAVEAIEAEQVTP